MISEQRKKHDEPQRGSVLRRDREAGGIRHPFSQTARRSIPAMQRARRSVVGPRFRHAFQDKDPQGCVSRIPQRIGTAPVASSTFCV